MFTANVFALMGLRQLYFLLGDLLDRLVYLSQGLAFILLFIGVKLILHALHENELPFINGGEGVHVPEIPTLWSLGVIILTLVDHHGREPDEDQVSGEALGESRQRVAGSGDPCSVRRRRVTKPARVTRLLQPESRLNRQTHSMHVTG